jgi:energy-coupling factor transporter ATP-binding protein EcfA2
VLLHCVDHAAVTWLHGSAVRIGNGAIAFLGPSGAGKSTLALALARAGAEHICDDTLPIEAGPRPIVWPTDHTIRLCSDSKGQLASLASATRRESDGKFVLTRSAFSAANVGLASEAPGAGRAPLAALYLLDPTEMSDSTELVTRRPVPPTPAIPALMRHLKLGLVVRPEDPARVVRQLGAIASSVPVFALSVSHDWTVVDEVVARILAWHAEPGTAAIAPVPALAVPA